MNIPLQKEVWESFDGKAKWDIMSALRGPDFRSQTLKWFATSVIRGRMREVIRVGGMVNEDLPLVIVPTIGSSGFGKFDVSHWRSHVVEAANWLQLKHVQVPSEILLATDNLQPVTENLITYVDSTYSLGYFKPILQDHLQFLKKMGY